MLIDSHCHLINEDYNIDEVINNAKENDVKYLIVSGSDQEDNRKNIELLNSYDNIFLSVGFHPCCSIKIKEEDYSFIEESIKNEKVVAIGEIGLDYYYGKDDIIEQQELFERQLKIAEKYNIPVVIHTRDAFEDTYNTLKKYNVKGVIHCFSGSLEVAKRYIDLGFYLGIGGVVTFKNSKLKEVVKEVGLSHIILETDSPYLSPKRGEKNEPANIKLIAEFLSELLGLSYDEVSKITTRNVIELFNLDIDL